MAVNPLIPQHSPREGTNNPHLQDGSEGDGVHNINFAMDANELAISAAGGGDGDGAALQQYGPHPEHFVPENQMEEEMRNPNDMDPNELEEEVHRAVNEMFALLVEYNANMRSQINELEHASRGDGAE